MHKKRKVELIKFHLEEAHRLIQELNRENTNDLHLCVYHDDCYEKYISFESLIKSIHQRYIDLPEYQGGRGC